MNLLDPQGPVAAANSTILVDSVAIMLAIVVPTIVAILGFAFWFREGNSRARYQPNFVYSGRVELVVWSIPALTVILLGGVAWIGSHQLDPAAPVPGTGSPVRIQAVSLDWKWLFIYPDQRIATVNTLTAPAGAELNFQLTSSSVMNVFFIPQLGSMIYTMNGMVTKLNLRADNEGKLQGLSAHFSGDGFPDMMFDVNVISQLAFPDWVAATAKSDAVLNEESYKKLMQQGIEKGRPVYRLEDPRLFDLIATQHIPPGPGPQVASDAPHSGGHSAR
ncbi:cytochrome ubiquinol oxidase subunit II [Bradyrhizobium manausense]|uniref:cytochrome ubiquinol oxidase subunit II n=1 Tax=Bradyrhizobium TaxID=374 RepID=UPI001BAB3E75|nr:MULTISPECIES: cytochrome ubiquinol oxidase subunit II [Bradyrhizobium]MBR0824501.1 cytochrome ubiquinol oxidase subunit II [Bradyrhizobium manausense]UVO26887.1 cytochrome ubiquinol oxidase subunit II [Bradyrhizobium arachidis]